MKPVLWLMAVEATLFSPDKDKPPSPYNRDEDGYYFMRKTHAVFDGRIDMLDTTPPRLVATTPTTGTTETSASSLSGSADETRSSEPSSIQVSTQFSHKPLGLKALVTDQQFDVAQERDIMNLRKVAYPLKGSVNPSLINDDLIPLDSNPLNPMYRDKTEVSTFVKKHMDTKLKGWLINVDLSSRSKRCKSFECADTAMTSISDIVNCIDESSPGCVLDAQIQMDLLNPVHMCCYDSELEPNRGAENSNAYFYSNYTWILPTPPMILDLAEHSNVTSFARFQKPYKTGFAATSVLSGGFALTRMRGGCADYRKIDIESLAVHVSNPAACDNSQVEYIDCHGWPSVNIDSHWNRTNVEQLVFSAVLNRNNCITAASQYQLLTARIVAGVTLYPSAGNAGKQASMSHSALSKANVALTYGYDEHPPEGISY